MAILFCDLSTFTIFCRNNGQIIGLLFETKTTYYNAEISTLKCEIVSV